ncbi:zinc ribbon domain-containing protein [Halorubrum sp. Atlit-26R]|uniref:zinc ribbon domain-containing protein n=1 Tax=Halorubrum sp. Atlit-26R TaxID=2282128 RepID=UPI000EF1C122|nr:zinc ribbon domain-containing protein [Halorubrum sp. Atlit-26R]RLM62627.1 zinc ribbon domain-containing protein [Halorubrum sp. Atlit-26R]
MVQASLRNNPLLAALLGTVVTGLGHLYLRRWLRALGWLGITAVASVLFIPEPTISALSSGTLTDPLSILPIVLISAASAFDAYLIAKTMRIQADEIQPANAVKAAGADESPACPACGKPVDPDLGFCHWCTTEFDVVDVTELQGRDETNSN